MERIKKEIKAMRERPQLLQLDKYPIRSIFSVKQKSAADSDERVFLILKVQHNNQLKKTSYTSTTLQTNIQMN